MFTSKKRILSLALALVLTTVLAVSTCTNAFAVFGYEPKVSTTSYSYSGEAPKYVFVFIGDGMSYPQIASSEMYFGGMTGKKEVLNGGGISKLSFSNFPVAGSCSTYDSTSFLPDSASTATSIASGSKTLSGVINMDVTKSQKFTPISDKLKAKGYKVGIVSSVPLNHATPAAFYAKVPSRNEYYDIALQAVQSGFDYFGGGSFLEPKGKNGDQENIIDVFKKNGYKVANTNEDIRALKSDAGKVVAINPNLCADGTAMSYEIDRKHGDLSLADFTKKGIDVLDNPNGFFMMVEGGKIDWSCHANDGAATIQDTLAFSDAVSAAIDFYNKHPQETLIIVTGDHETGGMTIGFAATGYSSFFDKMYNVTMSYEAFDNKVIAPYKKSKTADTANIEDLYPDIKKAFGLLAPTDAEAEAKPGMVLTSTEIAKLQAALKQSMLPSKERKYTDDEKVMYGGYEPLSVTLTHILNNKAGVSYTSYSHTGLPVAVFALGSGESLFNGYYDNTDISKKLCAILGVK